MSLKSDQTMRDLWIGWPKKKGEILGMSELVQSLLIQQ